MNFKDIFESNLSKTFNLWLNKTFAHLIDIDKEEEEGLKELKNKMVDDFIKYMEEKRFSKLPKKSLNESVDKPNNKKPKLFKLKVVKQMVDDNVFLKSKYDKLVLPTKDGGPEDRFGYHWGEVVHNILFNKYIKSDPEMLNKYINLKKNIDIEDKKTKLKDNTKIQDKAVDGDTTITENNNEEEIKESMTSGSVFSGADGDDSVSSFPVSPRAFASDGNEWKFKNGTKATGCKVVDDKTTKKHKIKLK